MEGRHVSELEKALTEIKNLRTAVEVLSRTIACSDNARIEFEEEFSKMLEDRDGEIASQQAIILELKDQLDLAKKEAEREERRAEELNMLLDEERKLRIQAENRYARRQYIQYTFEELAQATDHFNESNKLGEGGFGAVYKGKLHGMDVAVKHGSEGLQQQRQFKTEVELLSRIHHPHVVLLLGACPERACIVYEYMSNGSLEDRLKCKGGTPPLPWYLRLRICSEIATGLLFLHCRDQPIIHRDLKPGNILLDCHHVSKISDVGIAKLVESDVAQMMTTMPAGTFAYMDPEYLSTGFVTCASDVYALGIIILQLLTGKSPLHLWDSVDQALDADHGFEEILDNSAGEWPLAEAMELGKLGLMCAQRSPSDRPNLEEVLDILKKIREFADEAATKALTASSNGSDELSIPSCFFCPISQEIMTNPCIAADGFTYEHDTIKHWLQNHDTSPMTNLKLNHKRLTPNHSVKSAIREWSDRGLIHST